MTSISLNNLDKALKSLKKGFKNSPSELERDGLIQRFEFCVELSWKTSKKVLSQNGINVDTPKNVVRELGQLEWIEDPKGWIGYIDLRNEASHIYNEETANKVFAAIEQFIHDAEKLLIALETKNNP